MSVLCCHIPNLPLAVACRQAPALSGRPLALLGPDEKVWEVSPAAARCGVEHLMRPEAAQIACPDLLLRPLDLAATQAEQDALLAALAEWQLPLEPQGWGLAYIDLHAIANTANTVQPLAADLGRRLRQTLGEPLQPSLGWDSGKFTARAAASQAAQGRMRLVDKQDETRFLGPLPVALLPLPRPHLQQLHWLGIRTLGQFAQLPAAAVAQRFGAGGRQAQRWAQGRDDRPVRAAVAQPPAPVTVRLEQPSPTLQPVVAAVMASLHPFLAERAAALEGIRHLHLVLSFACGQQRTADLQFVEPSARPQRVQEALVQQLCRLPWPSELETVQWTPLACGELSAPQLALLAEPLQRLCSLNELADKLSSRCSASLFKAALLQPTHPAPERRSTLQPLANHLQPSALSHVAPLA